MFSVGDEVYVTRNGNDFKGKVFIVDSFNNLKVTGGRIYGLSDTSGSEYPDGFYEDELVSVKQ